IFNPVVFQSHWQVSSDQRLHVPDLGTSMSTARRVVPRTQEMRIDDGLSGSGESQDSVPTRRVFMGNYPKRVVRTIAAIAIGAVALAGCSGAAGSDTDSNRTSESEELPYGVIGRQESDVTPVRGGTL